MSSVRLRYRLPASFSHDAEKDGPLTIHEAPVDFSATAFRAGEVRVHHVLNSFECEAALGLSRVGIEDVDGKIIKVSGFVTAMSSRYNLREPATEVLS